MREYTLLAAVSVVIAVMLEKKLRTNLFHKAEYYLFLLLIVCFKLLVNGYLTSHIVIYNPEVIIGVRIGTIPVEDFLFGFSMVTICVSIWEFYKVRNDLSGQGR